MKSETNRATREAVGCFLMLVLGAMACVGFMRIAVLASSAPAGQSVWWQTVIIWLVAPAAAGALVAWLTYGFQGLRRRKKGG
jgi:uncharacterized membrane protein YdbT with pleckstrin-like domain